MKIRWIITTAFLLGLPSCLEQTRLNCPASYTLTIKRGESRALPDICTTHANPAATWDLAARDVSLMGTTSMGLPPGLELVVDAADPARASLVLRETEEAAADSPPYEIRLSAAPRFFRDGDVERPCVDSPTSCGVSDVALRVEFVDELRLGVAIRGVGEDGFVRPEDDVTLRAEVVGGSGQFGYRWEAWSLLAFDPEPTGSPVPIVVSDMQSAALHLGHVATEPQLYAVEVTDLATGGVVRAHRFLQSRTGELAITTSNARYPGSPVALGCVPDPVKVVVPSTGTVNRVNCDRWYLQRAENVPTADIDDLTTDALRLPGVLWSTVPLSGPPAQDEVEATAQINAVIAGREGLYRVVVRGKDWGAEDVIAQDVFVYTTALLPRRY